MDKKRRESAWEGLGSTPGEEKPFAARGPLARRGGVPTASPRVGARLPGELLLPSSSSSFLPPFLRPQREPSWGFLTPGPAYLLTSPRAPNIARGPRKAIFSTTQLKAWGSPELVGLGILDSRFPPTLGLGEGGGGVCRVPVLTAAALPPCRYWDDFHACTLTALTDCQEGATDLWEKLRRESKNLDFQGSLFELCGGGSGAAPSLLPPALPVLLGALGAALATWGLPF